MVDFSRTDEKKELILRILEDSSKQSDDAKEQDDSDTTVPFPCAVTYEFGEMTEEQSPFRSRSPLYIHDLFGDHAMEAGSEMCSLFRAWSELIREGKLNGGYCVRGAYITFGYKNKVYRIAPNILGMGDGMMEKYAPYILESLKLSGANYGNYIGFLD